MSHIPPGHAVQSPRPPFAAAGGALTIHQVPSWQDNLIWLIEYGPGGECAAVDGPHAEEVLAYCAVAGLKLGAILNTHTHGDHVGINRDLARRGLLDGVRVIGAAAVAGAVPGITEPVGEGDQVRLGEAVGVVMLTEGHIDGHVSYHFGAPAGGPDGVVFCGDTLFAGGCGYLFDGPPSKMHESLSRLAALPGGTRVCCAHEYTRDNLTFAWSVDADNEALAERIRRVWAIRDRGGCAVPSTIAEERATNPFLRHAAPGLRAAVAAATPGLDLADPAAVFGATRALKDSKRYRAEPPPRPLPA